MYKNYKVIEVTNENEQQYLPGIVELEKLVLDKMQQEGKNDQLFITGEEGIKEYINSDLNNVIIAVKNNKNNPIIASAVYITQGQTAFTYNDITKYFKCDENYQNYVKSKYQNGEFEKTIRKVYMEKICAFRYARDIILKEQGIKLLNTMNEQQRNNLFLEMVEREYEEPQNQFHEKSKIRDNLNTYMSLYMKHVKNDLENYQAFYWVDFDYLKRNLQGPSNSMNEILSGFRTVDTTIDTYDKILQYQKYKIYDKSNCQEISKYYGANTSNSIEIDTYITHPDNRKNGVARILVLEGIKKALQRVVSDTKNEECFLVSTLHEDNVSSKCVSEFFGLKDYLFVNRRSGRDRQVHIHRIKREEVPEYIEQMEKKIAVLYGYNPNNIQISNGERIEILNSQINYEVGELQRLENIKDFSKKRRFTGYIAGKRSKIDKLRKMVDDLGNYRKSGNENVGESFEGISVKGEPDEQEL